MPELPDVTVYVEHLDRLLKGDVLRKVRLASPKKRAWIRLVAGEEALAALDPGGLEPLEASTEAFAARLRSENHTLKRALTDPTLFSGIGNAYSDEILHRAKLSPIALTSRLTDADAARLCDAVKGTLLEWTSRLRSETGDRFPEKVTAFRPSTENLDSPARRAGRRFSASRTPATRRTTARPARRRASSWPTARSRGSSAATGRRASRRWRNERGRRGTASRPSSKQLAW